MPSDFAPPLLQKHLLLGQTRQDIELEPGIRPPHAEARGDGTLPLASENRYSIPMQAHRAETIVSDDGVITLRDLPFRRGESVEVIVLPYSAPAEPAARDPLRGAPVPLLLPVEPVGDFEWEASRRTMNAPAPVAGLIEAGSM